MEQFKNKILQCDALETMKIFPSHVFNLTITSPPYFNQRKYTESKNEIGSEKTVEEYIENLLKCFDECLRVTSKNGSIIFNIGDKYEDGSLLLVPYRFALLARQRIGVKLINEITWAKTNPTPRQYTRRLVSSKEPFFHFAQGDYYYDRNALATKTDRKQSGGNVGNGYFKQIMESDLTNEEKANACSELKCAIEEVRSGMLYSLRMKIRGIHALAFGGQDGGRNTQILTKGFSIIRVPGNSQVTDVIESSVETIRGIKHPAIYPLSIVEKLIKLTTKSDDLVLDPFIGSGTTAIACKNTGRHYVGLELSAEYIDVANNRLAK